MKKTNLIRTILLKNNDFKITLKCVMYEGKSNLFLKQNPQKVNALIRLIFKFVSGYDCTAVLRLLHRYK